MSTLKWTVLYCDRYESSASQTALMRASRIQGQAPTNSWHDESVSNAAAEVTIVMLESQEIT